MHLRASDVSLFFPLERGASAEPAGARTDGAPLGGVRIRHRGRVAIRALDRVSLSLGPGDRLGIIGHNGSGKSTLLRVLAGLYLPHEGHVDRQGEVSGIFNMSIGFRQEANGYRNILLKGLMAGRSRREIEAAIPEIADFTGLGSYLDMPLHSYSQGMALRLAFAITTTFRHDILVMDEWIGAGDASFQEKVVGRMNSMLEAASICVVASHNNQLLRRVTERCLWLEEGAVRAEGPTAEVLDAYDAEVRAQRTATRAPRVPIPAGHRALWLEGAPTDRARPFAATVCWDVGGFGVEHVRLVVVHPARGTTERVVATGSAEGERQTGPWTTRGMRFILRDADDDTTLAELEV